MIKQHPLRFVAAFTVCAVFTVIAVPTSTAEGTLVAHYEFEDPDDLGHDSSGMDNHAEVIEVEQVEGLIGQGGFFDESLASSFAKFDGLDGFTGKPGQTLAAWVKLDEATTGFDGIISQDAGECCENRILLHNVDRKPYINLSEHDDRHLVDAPAVEIDQWTHIVMTGEDIDGESEARVYINGVEVEGSPQVFPETDDGSSWNLYLGAGEGGTAHLLTGTLDDVRIYEGALTQAEIQALIPEDFDPDSDGDGLPDSWEELNGLDPEDPSDAGQDPDGDTLTSLQEFERGTDPNLDDTDMDGLKDNVETNTGTWVGPEDTGTDPTEPDSDGDGLSDSVETNTKTFVSESNTGTDPNLKDSDGDKVNDGTEVTAGSDPTDPDSLPASGTAVLVAHYEFEDPDDLGHDSSGLENHAEVSDVVQVEGQFGQAAFFDESLPSSFVKSGGLTGFTGKPGVTLAAWVKLDEATTGFDGIISQDSGACCDNRVLLHPDHNVFINLSEHDDRNLTGGPFVEFDEWTHIAMTGLDVDGESEARVYVNGVEVDDSPQIFPEMDDGSEWSTYLGAGEAGTAHLLTGALDDVCIYQGALTADEIKNIVENGHGSAPRFEITRITKTENELTLQWSSAPGRLYLIEATSDLSDPVWIEIDDGVDSEGALTEFTDDDPVRLGLPEIYYRVGEN